MAGFSHTPVATGFDEALVQRLLARALALSVHGFYLGRRERREFSRRAARPARHPWRRWCNDALANYAALWQRRDWLAWLKAPSFEIVPDWRWQQQNTLQQSRPGRPTMGRAQVETFPLVFERIGRHAQDTLAGIADEVIEPDARRRPR